jgi:phage terminase large subunit GpA-like protein
MMRSNDPVAAGFQAGFTVPERLTLSVWAERNIILSAERAASPGPFRIGDAAYQRGIMDAVTDPEVEVIVMLTSSQVGKTSILTAAQGYYAQAEPSPQLSVFPNGVVADNYLREQFEPTIRDSDTLRPLFDGLDYPGGYIAFAGANNPAHLAMRPIRVLTGDELDRWPMSSGKEGNPTDIAEKRTTTFRNRKKLYASTPLMTKTSQITALFKTTKQHYFQLVCPDCQHKQVLKWDQVIYDKGREDEARYACEDCGACWNETTKRSLVRDAEAQGGGWASLPKAPFKAFEQKEKPAEGRMGFWICELYSPWSSLAEMARAWSAAEGNPEKEQVFYNTRLGLPWDGDVSSFADAEILKARRADYPVTTVPRMAGLVTGAVDVQDDRLEVLTRAWGMHEESWILEKIVIDADPSIPSTWETLARLLSQRRYPHAAGKSVLGIEAVAIDSGGHFTQEVYKFVEKHYKFGRRWHAIRGVSGEGKPMWVRSKARFKNVSKLYLIGTHDAKTTLYKHYGILKPGPGYIHIHKDISDNDIDQMTAEYCETEYVNGFPKRTWIKKTGRRNELLDLMVYSDAVRNDVQIDMMLRLRKLHGAEEKPLDAEEIGRMFRSE